MSIGNALSEARTSAGLTIEAVSEATRIRPEVVQRIEGDDFTACGGAIYARGHVRTLARTVGLDPAPLVAAFDAAHPREEVRVTDALGAQRPQAMGRTIAVGLAEPPAARARDTAGGTAAVAASASTAARRRGARSRRALRRLSRLRHLNWTAVLVGACLIVLLVAVIELTYGNRSRRPAPAAIGKVGVTTSHPAPSHPPATSHPPVVPPPPAPPTTAAPPPTPTPTGVNVQVAAVSGTSWVAAYASDGHLLLSTTLHRGATQSVHDAGLVRLVIGNAGAVDLRVNGSDIGVAGRLGQVARVSFGPGAPTPTGSPSRATPSTAALPSPSAT